jgi:hypothetical protein
VKVTAPSKTSALIIDSFDTARFATEKADAQAGLLVVKILERRSLLLGLDSPQKLDIIQVQAQEAPTGFDKIRSAILRVARDPAYQPKDTNGGDGDAGDGQLSGQATGTELPDRSK